MKYIAGLDGGGTKTAVAVADLSGGIILEFESGPINPNGESDENVAANIRSIFARLNQGFEIDTACICAAGVSNPKTAGLLAEAVRQTGFPGRLLIKGDHIGALYGAVGKPYGAILVAGTGSICYGRDKEGREKRAGGYGYLIDDFGSCYAIGRDMLTAVAKAHDGRAEKTVLSEMVYRQLGIGADSIEELICFVYDKNTSKRDIAALAINLSAACSQNDKPALDIEHQCLQDLIQLVRPVVECLGLERDAVAISGGAFKNGRLREGFQSGLKRAYPGIRCHEAMFAASYGAALVALECVKGKGGLPSLA